MKNYNKYSIAFKRLYKELNPICQYYNKSKVYFLFDAAYCYLKYGASPHDYMNFEFYKLKDIERNKFLTMKRTHRVESIYNDKKYADYFNNKYKFNMVFSDFIKREWKYAPELSLDEFINFVKRKEKVIVKPLGLSSGKGIYALEINKINNFMEIYQKIKTENCLVEEFIKQHSKLMSANERTVNTIRVYTLIDKNDKIHIIFAALRVGSATADVDNFHNGGVGYPLDLHTGVVYKQGVDLKGNTHTYHPSSGTLMLGFKIPNWQNLKGFVLNAARKFPQSRYIAWDVAVLEDGFEMVEGNYNGDPGLLQALDKVCKKEIFTELR